MLTGFGIYNGYAPEQGPKAMPVPLDFTTVSQIKFDLLLENTEGAQDFVQGVYVDNTDNPNPLVLKFGITNQRIVIPANAQGLWPVLCPDQVTCVATTTPGAGVICQLILLNVPTAYTQWGPQTITVNTGTINATFTPTIAPTIQRGGSIAVGGTPQALFPVNAARKRMFVQNPGNAVEELTITFTSGAVIDLLPGQFYDSMTGPVSGEAVTVVAATAGHLYQAYEM